MKDSVQPGNFVHCCASSGMTRKKESCSSQWRSHVRKVVWGVSNNLLSVATKENGSGATWHVAYTAHRHEKAVASQLSRELETYLPVYRSVHFWKGRRAEIELPLFPNYVFVRFTFEERIKVLRHPSVVNILSFAGKPASLPDSEIELLRKATSLGQVGPHPLLVEGKRVLVKAGPLSGLEATVLRSKGRCRLVVCVKTIQRAFLLELDANEVELLPLPNAA
jgi:transcription antitermination factor NusG